MGLTWRLRLSYALGHVLNDLCASVWFTYTLVFFKFGIGIPTSMAGLIILVGQLVDGFVTPLIGLFSDKFSSQSSMLSSSSPVARTCTDNLLHNSHQSLANRGQNDASTYRTGDDTVATSMPRSTNSSFSQRCLYCITAFQPSGRKIWHLGGSVLVIFSFPLIFGPPLGSSDVSTLAKMIYYLPLVAIFQSGWASVQITHLALMNELSLESSERTLLTSLRYLSTVVSNLIVYLSTFLLLQHEHSYNNNIDIHSGSKTVKNITTYISPSENVDYLMLPMVMTAHPLSKCSNLTSPSISFIDFNKNDISAFQKLGFTITGIGGLTTLLFHLGIRRSDIVNTVRTTTSLNEGDVPVYGSIDNTRYSTNVITTWKDWLRLPLFWILGFCYMFVRLIVNVSQAYLTVYLLDSLLLPKVTMALVPLTVYVTSIVTIIVQKPIQDLISRELNSGIGLIFVTIFCILVSYPGSPTVLYRIYIAAGILGIGCTTILITSLAMVSDLIAKNQRHGAFVYGYMSFTDKLANGVVIQIIELLWNECSSINYYQNVESYGIGAFVLCQLIFICIYRWQKNIYDANLNTVHEHL
ncbi:unnamed protein product [Heterobilharzia americana]|nr:unnamed protein product [Heterobilharzia americana]